MFCYNIEQSAKLNSLHVVIHIKATFLVVIVVFFDSNSQGKNFGIFSCIQPFYSKDVVVD